MNAFDNLSQPSERGPLGVQTSLIAAQILYAMPFNDLLFEAHSVHRKPFDANSVQMSRLLSIVPLSMSIEHQRTPLRRGDRLLLTAAGAGLSGGAVLFDV